MNRIWLVAVMSASLMMLGACGRIGVEETELTLVDHIEAGMIEQDVFVEKTRGSNQVFRVGKAEAKRFADAPVYRTVRPVHHAPFSPANNGPYPKGDSLGISLGDWLTATRTLTDIYEKQGRSGPLIFYEVVMEIRNDIGEQVITEKTTRILR